MKLTVYSLPLFFPLSYRVQAGVNHLQDAAVLMSSETHSAEDVAIYATGPQSFLYTGTHEQSYIPLAMAYASCIGPYAEGKLACAKYEVLPHNPDPTPCLPQVNHLKPSEMQAVYN
ncbi:alkaline phosphatase [Plakobranchus ocellatus]|uniref:alkaline phosphatase n=1 Tax=Plakobranchus ocellatus TaxID=259542 RepID=A0AAV4B9K3_9GAST|nr:alkaline phosphatase [Plakobranchus ocellatus]